MTPRRPVKRAAEILRISTGKQQQQQQQQLVLYTVWVVMEIPLCTTRNEMTLLCMELSIQGYTFF